MKSEGGPITGPELTTVECSFRHVDGIDKVFPWSLKVDVHLSLAIRKVFGFRHFSLLMKNSD